MYMKVRTCIEYGSFRHRQTVDTYLIDRWLILIVAYRYAWLIHIYTNG